jgi:hypothetical protein
MTRQWQLFGAKLWAPLLAALPCGDRLTATPRLKALRMMWWTRPAPGNEFPNDCFGI